jgi:hypothetical protein
MTSVIVFIRGKYNERKDFEDDINDKNLSLNKHYFINSSSTLRDSMINEQKLDDKDLKLLKMNRIFETKLQSVIKEVTIYCIFLFLLFVVAFQNTSSQSFWHNQIFKTTFVRQVNPRDIGLNDVCHV